MSTYRHLPVGRPAGDLTEDYGDLEDPAGFSTPGDLAATGRVLKRLLKRRRDGEIELAIASEEVRRGDEIHPTLRANGVSTEQIPALCSLVCTGAFIFSKTGHGYESIRHEIELARYTTRLESISHGATTALRVPPDGPYSYEGMALTYSWRIEASEVDGRRFGWRPVWVLP